MFHSQDYLKHKSVRLRVRCDGIFLHYLVDLEDLRHISVRDVILHKQIEGCGDVSSFEYIVILHQYFGGLGEHFALYINIYVGQHLQHQSLIGEKILKYIFLFCEGNSGVSI